MNAGTGPERMGEFGGGGPGGVPARIPSPTLWLLAAVFVAILLNNIDKQILALLKPLLDVEFQWSERDYGRVAAASQLAAALCLPLAGWIADVVPLRRCLLYGVAVWSALTAAQALSGGVQSMIWIRAALNGAEALGTPAAMKVVSTSLRPENRPLAVGAFNMTSSIGAMVGAALVPAVAVVVGWRGASVAAGLLGLAWVLWWLRVSRSLPTTTAAAAPSFRLPARDLLRDPALWLLIAAKALTDQLWWIFLFWLPDLFHERTRGLAGPWSTALVGIYVCALLGSLAGGLLARRLWAGRRLAPRLAAIAGFSALAAAMLLLAGMEGLIWALVGCAAAIFTHQIVSVLTFSALSDDHFASRTGTGVGLAAFAGNLLAMGSLELVGRTLAAGGSYQLCFALLAGAYIAGGACLAAASGRMYAPRPQPAFAT